MSDEKRDYWFYVKSVGWGWGLPSRWQGWAVFIMYAALLFGGRYLFTTTNYRVIYSIALTIILVGIIAWKGERPLRWRWGGL